MYMKNFDFVDINQKDFNRNRNRLFTELTNKINIIDRKTELLIRDDISARLNEIIKRFDGKIDLNNITLEQIGYDF